MDYAIKLRNVCDPWYRKYSNHTAFDTVVIAKGIYLCSGISYKLYDYGSRCVAYELVYPFFLGKETLVHKHLIFLIDRTDRIDI